MSFCPFVKGNCIDDCIMKLEGECGIVKFLQTSLSDSIDSDSKYDQETQKDAENSFLEQDANSVAQELSNYATQIQSGFVGYVEIEVLQDFWKLKNLDGDSSSSRVRSKMSFVQELANKILENVQFQKEQSDLPSLIEKLQKWAMTRELKKVTKPQLEVFLGDLDINLSFKSKIKLQEEVNVLLKK